MDTPEQPPLAIPLALFIRILWAYGLYIVSSAIGFVVINTRAHQNGG